MPAEINAIVCEITVIGMAVMWGAMLIGAGIVEMWRRISR